VPTHTELAPRPLRIEPGSGLITSEPAINRDLRLPLKLDSAVGWYQTF
jgi:hypothetical protein